MHRVLGGTCVAVATCLVLVVGSACTGDDPTTGSVPSSSPESGADASGGDAAVADAVSDSPTGDALPTFTCPAGALICETWDDDPLLLDWTPELGGGNTLLGVPSTRYAGRALEATLVPAAVDSKARVLRDIGLLTKQSFTLRVDVNVASRAALDGGPAPELLVAGAILGDVPGGAGNVMQLLHSGASLTLRYDRDTPGDLAGVLTTPMTSGEWHSVTLTLDQGSVPSKLALQVDGVMATPASDFAVYSIGKSLRVFVGARSQPDTGATKLLLDNVVVTSF